jgi:tetratricopeptide (TPR) repeat protein
VTNLWGTTGESFLRAKSLFDEGRYGDAKRELAALIRVEPKRVDARYLYGLAALHSGDPEGALPPLRDTVMLDPGNAMASYHLGVTYERVGRPVEARAAYDVAVRLDPDLSQRIDWASLPGPSAAVAHRREPPPIAVPVPTSGSRPAEPTTLAADLDALHDGVADLRGRRIFRRHRALRSHGRHFVAIAVLLGLALAIGPTAATLEGDVLASVSEEAGAIAAAVGSIGRVVLLMLAAFVGLHMVFSAATTRCDFYERRIDFVKGVFLRRQHAIWLYDIVDIVYSQSLLMIALNTAVITIQPEGGELSGPGRAREPIASIDLVGLGGARWMSNFAEDLRSAVLRERRSMKKQWV